MKLTTYQELSGIGIYFGLFAGLWSWLIYREITYIFVIIALCSIPVWLYCEWRLKNKRSCLNCEYVRTNFYADVQEVNKTKIYHKCKGEIYCGRTMKRISKYNKNKGVSLDTPIWCPKRVKKWQLIFHNLLVFDAVIKTRAYIQEKRQIQFTPIVI